MQFWQPAEKFTIKFQNQNETKKFQPPPPQLFVWTQTKRDVLTNLSNFFTQNSEKLLLTMQKINFAKFKRKLTVFKTFLWTGSYQFWQLC